MNKYIKLIRVKHWLKNFLVFLPIFFSLNLFNINYIILTTLAFIVFCFTSSIVYILNDISDIEKDKLHPVKKFRPLASGEISKKKAYIVIGILSVIIAVIMLFFYSKTNNIFVVLIPLIYIVLNILYSKKLKNVPIIDVVILVSGFVLRVMYGGVAINVRSIKILIFNDYFWLILFRIW